MITIKKTLWLLLIILSVSSCKKYQDGPSFSLLTKKARIVADWKVTEYTINSITQNLSGSTLSIVIKKDGSYTSSYTLGSLSFNTDGKWEFSGDKDKVTFTPSTAGSSPKTSDILELRNTVLKLKREENGVTEITKYEPK